ncbi:MAG: aminotransferase class I/II-fold pyridoxal phosphate-dependent enzyme [Hyphomicrobiaceae bacterium]|nr:aminotransferase class I/II-fold pyridoxal phosphate-dependent enzyme [Hyphomicrobiaceae bacterium]
MTTLPNLAFEDYTIKRARLAGSGLLTGDTPWFVPIDALREQAERQGGRLLSFGNYDYLGLGDHPRVRAAAADALAIHGAGVNGSRLVGGERLFHAALERDLARFVGTEAALTLVSGYLTNLSLIPHLVGAQDLVVMDELAHNSIVMGGKSGRAEVRSFRHNDLDHLDEVLTRFRAEKRYCLIAVESLYSMDGDYVDLPRLLAIKEKHAAWLMVDEAHSIGVMGGQGRGICEHFGEDPQRIDMIIGTLSKTLVSSGGFICARSKVIEWLRYTLPGFVYSVGLSPVIAATSHAALALIEADNGRTRRLQALSRHFLARAREAGLDTGSAMGIGIVPLLFKDIPTTMMVARALGEAGIYAPPVVHVGVRADQPRIRFFISAAHTEADIDRVFEVVAAALAPAAVLADV